MCALPLCYNLGRFLPNGHKKRAGTERNGPINGTVQPKNERNGKGTERFRPKNGRNGSKGTVIDRSKDRSITGPNKINGYQTVNIETNGYRSVNIETNGYRPVLNRLMTGPFTDG